MARLVKDESGQMRGAMVQDTITKETWEVAAKSVINATGAFCDAIRCAKTAHSWFLDLFTQAYSETALRFWRENKG